MTMRHGGCACGHLRFEARGEPYRVGLCHCVTCRKVHGAPFHAFAIYPRDAVEIQGESKGYASSPRGRRHFCPACGSHVFSREEGLDEIELHLGAFDEPNSFVPSYEAFTPRRESWLGDLQSLVRHYAGNRPGPGRTEP